MPEQGTTRAILSEQPIIDFQTPLVDSMEKYPRDCSKQVNRANFMSLLINSFRVSRGDADAHFFFLEWASAQTGQDMLQIIREFYKALDASSSLDDVMSHEEQEFFLSSLHSVKTVGAHRGVTNLSLKREILIQLKPLVTNTREHIWEEFRERFSLPLYYGTMNISNLKSMDRSAMIEVRNMIVPKKAGPIPHD